MRRRMVILFSLLAFLTLHSPGADARELGQFLSSASSGLLTRLASQELCNCVFVDGVDASTCLEQILPSPVDTQINYKVDTAKGRVFVWAGILPTILTVLSAPMGGAQFDLKNPKYGCTLVQTRTAVDWYNEWQKAGGF